MKLSKVEKVLIETVDTQQYNTYHCAKCGIFQNHVSKDNGKCFVCKTDGTVIDVEKVRSELQK